MVNRILISGLFVLSCISSNVFGNKKHELGIGFGYIEYNPKTCQSFNGQSTSRWSQSLLPSSKSEVSFVNPMHMNMQDIKGCSTPRLYYTFHLAKDFNLRASFQRAQMETKAPISQVTVGPQTEFIWYPITAYDYTAKQIWNDYSVGFSFVFNPKQRFKFYAGADLTYMRASLNENFYTLNYASDPEIMEGQNRISKETFWGSQHFLGFQTTLCHEVSMRYECAGFMNQQGNYFIRPLNRLSINFDF